MKAVREIDRGPILNWIADQINYFGCWLVKITMPYALFYEVNLEDEEVEELHPPERFRDKAQGE